MQRHAPRLRPRARGDRDRGDAARPEHRDPAPGPCSPVRPHGGGAPGHQLPAGVEAARWHVTVLAGILDLDTGVFTFANAGHEEPLLAPPGGAEPRWIPGCGPLVGLFDRLDLSAQSVQILPGERLVLYTDGIPDAAAPDGRRFGLERLRQVIADSCLDGGAEDTSRIVIQSVLGFQAEALPADDLALLVIRRAV